MTVSQITGIVQLQPASPFDMFGVSTIEYSPTSCDSTSISAPHSPTSHIFDIDDERVSPATGDVETVDFGTEDQPRELKIGSPLSTDERDRLIHLLRSYLDVFAWSYEDMPGLDPSIVQHHLPILPHARPVKQKLRRLHPRWSLQDGKVRVCVDFRDLNKASPKDDFSLPHIDLLVDSTAGHSMLSFMDGFSGYNQILMAPEDMEKTTFITEWGTYCYKVMPFGDVEVYVYDMIRFFERIRKFRLRLNPKKCTFGVTSGKLLGHMVSERVPPTPGRPLLLYLSVSDMALGCMLAQIDDLGKEQAIYYLSKRMLEYEVKYVMIERLCLALVWATRRLRHYMTEYSVHLISRLDPLRYLFDRPALVDR
ncbi:hypothetical protein AAG906_010570 [Vitis piasezkii]